MITFFPSAFAPNRGANASAALLAGATVIASLAIATSEARAADDLIVKFDQTQLIRLARPIGEVIVGNPSIADVQVHSTNMLAVTGKGFGLTNVIVDEQSLTQISSSDELAGMVAKVIEGNTKPVADYRGGKESAIKAL